MPRRPPRMLELVPNWAPLAYAVTAIDVDQAEKAVLVQVVRIGLNTDVPDEGHQFYWMTIEHARELRDALTQAVDTLEPPPATPEREAATTTAKDGRREPG